MMMGHGSHVHGGTSPCSSTLSPLAPPFTVAASGPKPVTNPLLVDLKETNYFVTLNPSLHNWTSHGPQPHDSGLDYFSVPTSDLGTVTSSNAYGFSPSTTHVTSPNPLVSASSDAAFFGKSSFGLVEAEPYYSSYVSPAIGDDSQLFASQQSGYDLLSSPQVPAPNEPSRHGYAQNFSSMEHGKHWDGGSGWWEGLTDWQQSEPVKLDEGYCTKGGYTTQGTETCRESRSTGNDYVSFHDRNLEFFPSTCLTASGPKVTLDTHAQPPPLKVVNSRYQKIQPFTSYHKCKRDDVNSNDSKAVTGSLPAAIVSVPVQDSYSFRNTNGGDDKDSAGNSSVGKYPQPFKGSEGIICFDANQLSFHPRQSDCILEFSGCSNPAVDPLEQIFIATTETKSSGTNPECSTSSGCCGKAINSLENYPESLDSYNLAVDSPCWKGAPVSQWSSSQVYEVVTPQNMKIHESCNGMNDQDSPSFPFTSKDAVEVSPAKESEKSVPYFDRSLECSVGSFKKHLVASMLFKEGINDDMKPGQHLTRPEYCHGIQISDDIHEPWKGNLLSDKSIHDFGFNPSHGEQQHIDEEKRTSDKNCAPRLDVVGDEKRINDEPDGCSSQLPFLSVEDLLCPHPSAGDAAFKLTKPLEPMPKGYAQMLVNTLHNLSELLQFHFSNDACKLKEENCDLLMNVINNLNTCMERKGPMQESVVPQSINSLERSAEVHKVMNLNSPPVLRIDAANCTDHLKSLPQVQDKEHNITHVTDDTFSNFATAMAAADVVKEDTMTQAIKKVLAENFDDEEEKRPQVLFYKNLWLEAEASLCIANSMARFNRMKIEMGNCHVSKANELPENSLNVEYLPRSKVTSDPSPTGTIEAGNKDDPLSHSSIPDSPVSATSDHADDVMARFHILKTRVDYLSSVDTSVAEKLSGSKLSTEGQTDKLAHETMDAAAKQETPIQDIFMSSTRNFLDVEASVLSRFQILRCRDDNSRSVDMETHQLEGIDNVATSGLRMISPSSKHGSEDDISDVNMEPVGQNTSSNSNADKSTVKEIHLFVNNDPVAQSCMTYELGDHSHASRCDSASSDWEHILKEECAYKNC